MLCEFYINKNNKYICQPKDHIHHYQADNDYLLTNYHYQMGANAWP